MTDQEQDEFNAWLNNDAEIGDRATIRDLIRSLREITEHIREDIPEEQGSKHLWEAVEDGEILLAHIAGEV